jgi:hypothetical protein
MLTSFFQEMACLYKHHPGLDTTRQTYTFEKIRVFLDEEAKDITCPASKSRAGQKQALRM